MGGHFKKVDLDDFSGNKYSLNISINMVRNKK